MAQNGRTRRLTDDDIRRSVGDALATLRHLCEAYDGGAPRVAAALATHIRIVVTENPLATQIRADRRFIAPLSSYSRDNLLPEHRIIIANIRGNTDGASISFTPRYTAPELPTRELAFRDWWNRDVIFRSGSGQPGTPVNQVPAHEKDRVPYEKRETYTRRSFIDHMRNKVGAHLDAEIPETLATLIQSDNLGYNFNFDTGSKLLRTEDGSMQVGVGMSAAMLRQIAQEVLVGYADLLLA